MSRTISAPAALAFLYTASQSATIRYGVCVSTRPISSGCRKSLLNGVPSTTEPNITIPLPKVSCACATVPSGLAYTACFSKPNARQSQSIAAGASRYRNAGITVDLEFFAPDIAYSPGEILFSEFRWLLKSESWKNRNQNPKPRECDSPN